MSHRKVRIIKNIERESHRTGEPMGWKIGALEDGEYDSIGEILEVNWG